VGRALASNRDFTLALDPGRVIGGRAAPKPGRTRSRVRCAHGFAGVRLASDQKARQQRQISRFRIANQPKTAIRHRFLEVECCGDV
jgi:hypothetical protein